MTYFVFGLSAIFKPFWWQHGKSNHIMSLLIFTTLSACSRDILFLKICCLMHLQEQDSGQAKFPWWIFSNQGGHCQSFFNHRRGTFVFNSPVAQPLSNWSIGMCCTNLNPNASDNYSQACWKKWKVARHGAFGVTHHFCRYRQKKCCAGHMPQLLYYYHQPLQPGGKIIT